MPTLRPITTADFDAVLSLNKRNVEALAPLDEVRLKQLQAMADRFDVIDTDDGFGGFVITFAPGTAYDSANYRWFTERYGEDFYYLDRIVLPENFRRHGLGGFVYDDVEATAKQRLRLALEVNLRPRNHVSLAFHDRRGFTEVGRLGDDVHLVSLMTKELR